MITDRQAEILARHANGQSLTEISSEMYLSYITVRKDVAKAKKKLNAVNLAQVVALAIIQGRIRFDGKNFNTVPEANKINLAIGGIENYIPALIGPGYAK